MCLTIRFYWTSSSGRQWRSGRLRCQLRPLRLDPGDWYGHRGWSRDAVIKTMTRIDTPGRDADLPPGTFERELGKEGFFGPATHMYHRHPPTAWTSWEGPLRPRAFDLSKLAQRRDSSRCALSLFLMRFRRYWMNKVENIRSLLHRA